MIQIESVKNQILGSLTKEKNIQFLVLCCYFFSLDPFFPKSGLFVTWCCHVTVTTRPFAGSASADFECSGKGKGYIYADDHDALNKASVRGISTLPACFVQMMKLSLF